jgi:hypothetical protein
LCLRKEYEMAKEAVVVFTAKLIDRVLAEGGTSAWRLDPNRAARCEFVVCTRNTNAKWSRGPETHKSAFLVGRISNVVPCPPTPENHEAPNNRYLIQFIEFARVDIPDYWEGDRNPIGYRSIGDLGIDPSTLKWEPMPKQGSATETAAEAVATLRTGAQPLSLADAKKGLALTFNVPPEAIEITIRG